MSNITPGQFSVEYNQKAIDGEKFHRIVDEQDVTVALVLINPLDPKEWSKGTAKLFGASKDLLETCRQALADLDDGDTALAMKRLAKVIKKAGSIEL